MPTYPSRARRARFVLDRSSAIPLWSQLRDDISRRLAEGEFTAEFPGEMALAADYHVSRYTVREALRSLREAGLVHAGRGRTPMVATPMAPQTGALYSLFDSVEEGGLAQRSVIRALDARADGIVAARLHLEESMPLVYLERLRLAGDEPLAIDRVWLPARIASPLLAVDFSHTSLYGQLATKCGVRISGGRERVRAIVPSAAQQAMLGIEHTVAAMAIDRLGMVDGQPVEWRETLIRADRFVVTRDLNRPEASFVAHAAAWPDRTALD